eukprot:1690837-Prymnesium_polylepis.1
MRASRGLAAAPPSGAPAAAPPGGAPAPGVLGGAAVPCSSTAAARSDVPPAAFEMVRPSARAAAIFALAATASSSKMPSSKEPTTDRNFARALANVFASAEPAPPKDAAD